MKSQSTVIPRSARTAASRKSRSCAMPRPGQKCRQCQKGKLDYDGLLNLVCPQCGHTSLSGSFT